MARYSVEQTKAVIQAARDGDNAVLLAALAKGGSATGFHRWVNCPPLHKASTVEVAQALIAHGARIEGHSMVEEGGPRDGPTGTYFSMGTALHFVNDDVTCFLISQGADVNAECAQNYTPLMRATQLDDLDKMDALIAAGADPNHKCWSAESALHRAASDEAVFILVAAGANLEARNNCHETPLLFNVCQKEVAIALCKAGADPLAMDQGGITALQRAERYKKSAVVNAMNLAMARRLADQLEAGTIQAESQNLEVPITEAPRRF